MIGFVIGVLVGMFIVGVLVGMFIAIVFYRKQILKHRQSEMLNWDCFVSEPRKDGVWLTENHPYWRSK
jgi:hypothetical protein